MAIAPGVRSGGFRSLRDVASRRGGELAPSVSRLALHAAWNKVVGSSLRSVTRPVALQRGCLTIEVSDASWKRAIEPLGPMILGSLREHLPDTGIDEIRYRLAP
jgi:hypothetical protein